MSALGFQSVVVLKKVAVGVIRALFVVSGGQDHARGLITGALNACGVAATLD